MPWERFAPPQKLISGRGDRNWPIRRPDLNLIDFFLWGYFKSEVFTDKTDFLTQFKENTR